MLTRYSFHGLTALSTTISTFLHRMLRSVHVYLCLLPGLPIFADNDHICSVIMTLEYLSYRTFYIKVLFTEEDEFARKLLLFMM